eukprot:PLAT14770.1.p1 GENE.PLAT14770.1~~PLAT14770.1.p1  ORF type:complete len:368 (-),score=169.34 PLAT14770.1:156-1259(-)
MPKLRASLTEAAEAFHRRDFRDAKLLKAGAVLAVSSLLYIRRTFRRRSSRRRKRARASDGSLAEAEAAGSEEGDALFALRYGARKLVTHTGSCHCGAVRFAVAAPAEINAVDCSCSICTKKGRTPHLLVPASRFRLLTPVDALSLYQFGSGSARHLFCRHCGVHAFGTPRDAPDEVDVNVLCLDASTISKLTVSFFDGAHLLDCPPERPPFDDDSVRDSAEERTAYLLNHLATSGSPAAAVAAVPPPPSPLLAAVHRRSATDSPLSIASTAMTDAMDDFPPSAASSAAGSPVVAGRPPMASRRRAGSLTGGPDKGSGAMHHLRHYLAPHLDDSGDAGSAGASVAGKEAAGEWEAEDSGRRASPVPIR